jgi:hypothetical protein
MLTGGSGNTGTRTVSLSVCRARDCARTAVGLNFGLSGDKVWTDRMNYNTAMFWE